MSEGDLIFNKPFLAFDRSQDSEKMLMMFDSMSNFTSMTLLHVHDPMKSMIIMLQNRGLQIQKYLQQRYSQNKKVKIILKEVQDKKINQIILQTYLGEKSNILWFGFTGLKGRKPRNQDLCSRIRQYIYDSKIDLAIIKCKPKGTNKIIYCCDGSDPSLEGLKKAILFTKMHHYSLTIFHASHPDIRKYSKHLRAQLKNFTLKQTSIQIQVVIEEIPLIDYLIKEKGQFQWVIVTKNGYRGQISKKFYVGSNTTDIICNVQANILLMN